MWLHQTRVDNNYSGSPKTENVRRSRPCDDWTISRMIYKTWNCWDGGKRQTTQKNAPLSQRKRSFPQVHIAKELSNSMVLSSSWEAASCAANQFPNILRNPKLQYRLHNSPPLVLFLSQMNPVHITPSYVSEIQLRLGLPSGLFPSGFPTKIIYAFLSSPCVLHALPTSSSLKGKKPLLNIYERTKDLDLHDLELHRQQMHTNVLTTSSARNKQDYRHETRNWYWFMEGTDL
jgi:hypothetical protein